MALASASVQYSSILKCYGFSLCSSSLKVCSTRGEEEVRRAEGWRGERRENLICYFLHKFYKEEGRRGFHLLYSSNELILSLPNWSIEKVNSFLKSFPSPSNEFMEHSLRIVMLKNPCLFVIVGVEHPLIHLPTWSHAYMLSNSNHSYPLN